MAGMYSEYESSKGGQLRIDQPAHGPAFAFMQRFA